MDFLDHFITNFDTYWYWEPIATVTAIIYVILASKANKLCFVFGLISSLILTYICYESQLYFDTSINVYYVFMSLYGWYAWSKPKNLIHGINRVPRKILFLGIGAGVFISILLALVVDRFADPQLPYIDAFTTIFSIFATWMVIKKYIENWLIWIVVDLVAAGMYFYKNLYFISILFFVYTIIAVFGYFKWKKIIQHQ